MNIPPEEQIAILKNKILFDIAKFRGKIETDIENLRSIETKSHITVDSQIGKIKENMFIDVERLTEEMVSNFNRINDEVLDNLSYTMTEYIPTKETLIRKIVKGRYFYYSPKRVALPQTLEQLCDKVECIRKDVRYLMKDCD
jgi:hypothetical protein